MRVGVSDGMSVGVSVGVSDGVSVGVSVGVRGGVEVNVGASVMAGGTVASASRVGVDVGASDGDVSLTVVAFVCGVGDDTLDPLHAVKQKIASAIPKYVASLFSRIGLSLSNPYLFRT